MNGSTDRAAASAVMGSTNSGDCILMARNCHKSVYNAVFMNQLHPIYIYPENGAINPGEVKRILEENPRCEDCCHYTPTYEGVVSDVERIAGNCS